MLKISSVALFGLAVLLCAPSIAGAVTKISSGMSVSATVVRTCTTVVGVNDDGGPTFAITCSDGATTEAATPSYSLQQGILVITYH